MPVTPSEVKQTISRHALSTAKNYTTLCMINEIISFNRIKNEHSYVPFFLFLQPCKAKKGKERKGRVFIIHTCLGLLPAYATIKT